MPHKGPSLRGLGGSLPYAFAQEGVATLSRVLRSQRPVEVNIAIMGAFVRLRERLATPTPFRVRQRHDISRI